MTSFANNEFIVTQSCPATLSSMVLLMMTEERLNFCCTGHTDYSAVDWFGFLYCEKAACHVHVIYVMSMGFIQLRYQ